MGTSWPVQGVKRRRSKMVSEMMVTFRFRAGICDYDEDTKICTPKACKGEITINPSSEASGFYDFVWKPLERYPDRTIEPIELILIPGETKWIHLESCKTGRVFCLLFSSGERYFFWLQEKVTEDDSTGLCYRDKSVVIMMEHLLTVKEDEAEEGEQQDEDVAMEDAPPEPPQNDQQPIESIADFLTKDLVVSYVQSMGEDSPHLAKLYQFLPTELGHNRETLLECVRGPFFAQALKQLSKVLAEGYSGQMVAEALGYQYDGEGVIGFLRGMRAQGKKEDPQ